ncbi:MAG: rod shape-determining protein RodA [Frankiaceae bacterium]
MTRARSSGWSRALDRESPLRRADWILAAAALAMSLFGAVLVWAATRPHALQAHLDPTGFLKKHLLNLAIGLVLAVVTTLVDYRLLRAYTPVVYVLSCIGLVAVLSPLGATVNGAKSWIAVGGGFTVQPSEFAKIALVVGLAMFLGEKREGADSPPGGDVLIALGLCAVPIGLIMLQPDLGTVLVLVFLIFVVLAVSGVPTRWLAGLVLVGGLLVYGAVQAGALSKYQVDRITAFTHPNDDSRSTGWNTAQARIAIGSGGVLGKGLFQGPQTNGQFVPEQQTDFVYTVAGEEFGLVGAGGIIALFGVVLWRGLRIASRATDAFGTLVAVGVVAWFTFQGFENIGMTLGIMPVTGLPLPFVSYGGSSMFANMMAIGLLQNVHLRTSAS